MKNIINNIVIKEHLFLLKKTGVYKIKNKENNKVYIGSTATSFTRRLNNHISSLLKNKHHSKHLQNSFNKNKTFDKFEISILEICDPANCIKEEQKWINFYNASDDNFGYNISPAAASCLGLKKTLEEKIKIFNRLRTVNDDNVIKIFNFKNNLNYSNKKISNILNINKNIISSILTKPNKYKYIKEQYNLKLTNNNIFTKNDILKIYNLYEISKISIKDISIIFNVTYKKIAHLIKNKNTYKDIKKELNINFNYDVNRKNIFYKNKNRSKYNMKLKNIIPIDDIKNIFKLKYIDNYSNCDILDFFKTFKLKDIELILSYSYQKRKYTKYYLEIKKEYNLINRNILTENDIINIFNDYNSGKYLINELNIKYNYCDVSTILANSNSSNFYKKIINDNNLVVNKELSKNIKLKSESMANLNKQKAGSYKLINPNGDEFLIKNLSEFCRENNFSVSSFSRISNKDKKYKGWSCFRLS